MSRRFVEPPTVAAEPALLTVAEACTRLRISRWMLYRLIHTRQLASIKLGRRRLIPQSAIGTLVERMLEEAD
jgi:excisionase family DNA binding protein